MFDIISFILNTQLWMLQMAMQGFTEKIVGLMKSENLFESQGGPIILSQVNFRSLAFSIWSLFTFVASKLCKTMSWLWVKTPTICRMRTTWNFLIAWKKVKRLNPSRTAVNSTYLVKITLMIRAQFMLSRLRMSMGLRVSCLGLLATIMLIGRQIWLLNWERGCHGWCARKKMPRIQW